MKSSEVKFVHALILLWSVGLTRVGGRISSLLSALRRTALAFSLLDHVVHDEHHGEVRGVCHRVLSTILYALFNFLACAATETRFGPGQVLIDTYLIQIVGTDVIYVHVCLLRLIVRLHKLPLSIDKLLSLIEGFLTLATLAS